MKKRKFKIVLIFLCLSILSCSGSKPPLNDIPLVNAPKVYYIDSNFWHNGDFMSLNLMDSSKVSLLSIGAGFTLFNFNNSKPLKPSFSPKGNYIALIPNRIRFADFKFGRKAYFEVYDIYKKEFVLEMVTNVPIYEHDAEMYSLQWSNDEGFYVCHSDSIIKYYPNGRNKFLLRMDDLNEFCVSPNEESILIYHDDVVDVYNMTSKQLTNIIKLGKVLGINMKFVKGISWSRNSRKVAFTEGWKIYIYDIYNERLQEYKADGKVFYTNWISDNEIIYVLGESPSDMAKIRTTQSFKMFRLTTDKMVSTLIHERVNHEPFSIKPISISNNNSILFSEKKINGGYQIKLMDLDKNITTTICDGSNPYYIK